MIPSVCTDGELLDPRYSPWQVILSYIVVVNGSFGAVVVLDHLRLCAGFRPGTGIFHMPYLFASLSLGIGIWGMHFREELETDYELFLTLLSLVLSCTLVRLGFWQASNDLYFASDRAERLKTLMVSAYKHDMKALRSRRNAIHLAYFGELKRIFLAAVLMATGVLAMHFTGKASLHGQFRQEWNYGILTVSIILALVVSLAGVWIMFRLLVWKPTLELLRVGAAAVIGLAACSMHYTGMYAASYYCDKDSTWLEGAVFWKSSSPSFEFVIVILTLNLTITAVLSVAVDLRTNFLQLTNTNFSHFTDKLRINNSTPTARQPQYHSGSGGGAQGVVSKGPNVHSSTSVGGAETFTSKHTSHDLEGGHNVESAQVELNVRQQQLVIQQRGERKETDDEMDKFAVEGE